VADGLAADFVTSVTRDREGALWFGTISGLSRLPVDALASTPVLPPPTIFIAGVRISGVDQAVSELGETQPQPFVVPAGRGPLEVEYFGFSFEPGAPLRYQYRLAGANGDWSLPSEQRGVTFANLAAGSYRFLVRAVRADGIVSPAAAALTFKILPPLYARWWFIAAVAVGLAGLAFVGYRVRVAQLLRVERVRARIATDLHDDIGASLSQIAILAEVARERMRHAGVADQTLEPPAAEPLARIAETSRGLVDSMSDIVWAINPAVDSLADLVHRMRRFVEDTLGAAEIDVTFRAPDSSADMKLGADLRREIFLILKESVTNIAKHARATRVSIDFEQDGRRLRLRISDNGEGFDPAGATDGNGVTNMRRRVAALGGHLAIHSTPGLGTEIMLEVERHSQ
jgi:signal transduction histidine kinase